MNRPANILIVEDEHIVALDLAGRLRKLGYVVPARASNSEAALREVAETRPDLVLMDIRLKGTLDGITTAAAIRERFGTPVVYLTAHSDEKTLARAKATAPHGYLLKPFEEGTLRTTIEMALYRYQLEQALQANRRWLTTTLHSIGEAVLATDSQGRIAFMNPLAERITGWIEVEAVGREVGVILQLVGAGTGEQHPSPIAQALEQQRPIDLAADALLVTKVEAAIPVEGRATPIRDEEGRTHGVVLVFQDVSERKKTEERLRRLSADLETKNAELEAFARTVARDLKSPLDPITGFADYILSHYESLPTEQLADYLGIIARNAQQIRTIIDELLLLAQVSKDEAPLERLDMALIAAQAKSRLTYMTEQRQGTITLPQSWPAALGYAPWIEEVWVEYLSIGLKYGGIPPHLKMGSTVQADGQLCFWVRDNGPGLSREEQARLFAPFTRLDRFRAKGHGLGLSIVQSIVTKLGGKVGVESEGIVGQGCLFYFTLPAA